MDGYEKSLARKVASMRKTAPVGIRQLTLIGAYPRFMDLYRSSVIDRTLREALENCPQSRSINMH